uniref:Bifunctional inhibitor/plant lipid transfer protein/seed storage helical domain-containing protein n=1 Tax=Oryza barthii TaxID=65489 RepID=A0A0D3FGA3_9ORYZ
MPSTGTNPDWNSSPSTSPGGDTDARTNSSPDAIAGTNTFTHRCPCQSAISDAASQVVGLGNPLLNQACCSQLSSLPSDTAAVCLCEAIKVNALVNLKVKIPDILKVCGKVSAVVCV